MKIMGYRVAYVRDKAGDVESNGNVLLSRV